jgi:UDP-glucose 4-epimerase
VAQRLCCSLQVDIGTTRELLGWHPPVTVDLELQNTVDFFLAHQAG